MLRPVGSQPQPDSCTLLMVAVVQRYPGGIVILIGKGHPPFPRLNGHRCPGSAPAGIGSFRCVPEGTLRRHVRLRPCLELHERERKSPGRSGFLLGGAVAGEAAVEYGDSQEGDAMCAAM